MLRRCATLQYKLCNAFLEIRYVSFLNLRVLRFSRISVNTFTDIFCLFAAATLSYSGKQNLVILFFFKAWWWWRGDKLGKNLDVYFWRVLLDSLADYNFVNLSETSINFHSSRNYPMRLSVPSFCGWKDLLSHTSPCISLTISRLVIFFLSSVFYCCHLAFL